jgi:hypothetical protein
LDNNAKKTRKAWNNGRTSPVHSFIPEYKRGAIKGLLADVITCKSTSVDPFSKDERRIISGRG